MEENDKVLKEYVWPLKAFLDIDIHRTFYNNIKENEEITLVCKSVGEMKIITNNGYAFTVYSRSHFPIYSIVYNHGNFSTTSESKFDYFYYAIKNGAVFKGYISDIGKNGAFNVRVFQYVSSDYVDPKKEGYTETFVNAGLGKTYQRSSIKYKEEMKEEKREAVLGCGLLIVSVLLLFVISSFSAFYGRLFAILIMGILIISLLVSHINNKTTIDLEAQIKKRICKEEERKAHINQTRKIFQRIKEEKSGEFILKSAMEFAFNNKERVHISLADNKHDYFCPICHGKVIPQKIETNTTYFAHQLRCCDDWYYDISEWHSKWQNLFPEKNREVIIEHNNEKHRADVMACGYVIEFQHNPITMEEFDARNKFYLSYGKKVIWIFDFIDEFKKNHIHCYDRIGRKFFWRYSKRFLQNYLPQENKNIIVFFQFTDSDHSNNEAKYIERVIWAKKENGLSNFEYFGTSCYPNNFFELLKCIKQQNL